MSVPNADLIAALGDVARLDRRPSDYRTSHALEEVDAELAGGTRLELMLKELGDDALHPDALAAKPDFLRDPLREIEVYERVLAKAGLGTAHLHGRGPDWLLLERVPGIELYQVGDRALWEGVARWLAGMHGTLDSAGTTRLVGHDRDSLAQWAGRAAANAPAVASVAAAYDSVLDILEALPAAVIHGELYASNVLVAGDRVCPVDWELAGTGPALLDVAALVAGGWSDENRRAIALAYRAALADPPPEDEFLTGLDAARLHVALQWLGWSPTWTPPVEHRHDWAADALQLAARLGV